MAIDRVGSGSASQRAAEQLALAKAASARASSPATGGAGATRDTEASGDADRVSRSAIARIAARAANLQGLTARAETVSSALAETTGLLDEMRAILRDQAQAGTTRTGMDAARHRLADIAASIATAEARASGEAPEASNAIGDLRVPGSSVPGYRHGFAIADVNDGVTRVSGKTNLPPGSLRDIELEVLTSGVAAEFGMAFRGMELDLASPSSVFRIEVAGSLGSRELSFASGTRVQQIVATINSFASLTGVSAQVDADSYGVKMFAQEGSGNFVSLRILDDGGVRGGLYGLNNTWYASFGELDLSQEFRENSSSLTARVNGVDAEIQGRTIISKTADWDLSLSIDESLNRQGTHNLFALFSTGGQLFKTEEIPAELAGPIDARAHLTDIAASIATGAARGAPDIGSLDLDNRRRGFVIADTNPDVKSVSGTSHLPPGTVRDIELEVLASASTAEVHFYFHNTFGFSYGVASGSFTIEIAGADGITALSFVSGTSTADMAAAINARTGQTGVTANGDGPGLSLNAAQKDGEFVSVRILESSGVLADIYDPQTGRSQRMSDVNPDDVFRDESSEWKVAVNGVPAEVQGTTVFSNTDEWSLRIELDDSFSRPGTDKLFTLFSTGAPQPDLEEIPAELTGPVDAGVSALQEARAVSEDASTGRAGVEHINATRAGLGQRLEQIRALLNGPLGEATAGASATMQSLLRDGPKSGWRIDARG